MNRDSSEPREGTAGRDETGMSCPYCRFPLKERDEITSCGVCSAPHHSDCWADNAGCAVVACPGGPAGRDPAPVESAPSPGRPNPGPHVPPSVPPSTKAKVRIDPMPAPRQPAPRDPESEPGAVISGEAGTIRIPDKSLIGTAIVVLLIAIGGAFLLAQVFSTQDAADPARPVAPAPEPRDDSDGGGPLQTPNRDTLASLTPSQIKQGAQEIIRRWHVLASQGDTAGIWANLSPRKRRQKATDPEASVSEFLSQQADFGQQLSTPGSARVRVVDVDRQTGGVEIYVSNLGYTGACVLGTQGDKWVGITWVKYQNGRWYYEPGYSTTQERRDTWESDATGTLGGSCNPP